ncbi:hypothetical protein H4Q26_006737 [Puccinia striiformis f. sp. tritici PST-130]|nr:hypothetical protein H4Q26_006737 [Puccinia striiformis f. sp. tritici PST-130]
MSTQSTGLPLLAPTDPEAIIRAANAERRRLEEATLDPIRTDSPTPSTPFRTPTESDSSSLEHLSTYLAPKAHPNMSSDQPINTDTQGKVIEDSLAAPLDKSASTDDHLKHFLQIQSAGAIQIQEAIRAVLNIQRVDREAAAEERRESAERIALAAVDEAPVPTTTAEEFESFPPPAFEDAELSVIDERSIDSIAAVQLHEDEHLAPEFCAGDLTQAIDWHDLAAVQEDVASYGPINFGRDPLAEPPTPFLPTANTPANTSASNATSSASNTTTSAN